MKNKLLISLLICPFIFLIPSCGNSNNPPAEIKVNLTYSTYCDTDYIDLNYEEFKSRMNVEGGRTNIESFIIFTYSNCGCISTYEAKAAMKAYVETYNVPVYGIEGKDNYLYDYYSGSGDATKNLGLEYRESHPVLHIIDKGVVVWRQRYSEDFYKKDATTGKYTTVNETLNSKIIKSKLFKVDENYLEDNINSLEKAVLFFGRNGCGDCQYVLPNILSPYLISHTNAKNVLYFDIQDHWASESNPEQYKKYIEFKTKWGLSVAGSEDFGYGSGVVPTAQYLEYGVIKDACVFTNDSLEKSAGNKVLIKESYWHERANPFMSSLPATTVKEFVGLDVTDIASEYSGYYYLEAKNAAKYHTPLLTGFLDYYLLET
ncbi:MAG: hypothetical protein MJ227_03830 [Bacilli bacterium]|nr:hypothetical protein [Bacilli bacterium]